MAQWVKDLVLSLLWCGFGTWPENFQMLQALQKKKKEERKKKKNVPSMP